MGKLNNLYEFNWRKFTNIRFVHDGCLKVKLNKQYNRIKKDFKLYDTHT